MNRLTEILQKHIWCILFGAFITLVATITILGGEDESLVSHVSLAASVSALILAAIVIIYSMIVNARAERNLEEMRGLILQLETGMRRGIDELAKGQRDLKKLQDSGAKYYKSSGEKKYVLKRSSATGLLALKWLAHTEKSEKQSTLKICAREMGLSTELYIQAFLVGFMSHDWGAEVVIDMDRFKAIDLPTNFKQDVENALDGKVREFPSNIVYRVEETRKKIEEYFKEG